MPAVPSVGGRHELGQNFLFDPNTITTICAAVRATTGPIVELGPGDGALTVPLSRSGRVITAVELDPRRARRLAARTGGNVTVVTGDLLRHRFPRERHTVVGNIPFPSPPRPCAACSTSPLGTLPCCWCSGRSPGVARGSAEPRS
ncbi:MAG TPA: rRNA adenine N-6-methyltransferase family protein [Amycolatopsis sp.]|jgi:23S rRNA (adenine-N6)-dimethyltransferase